MAAPNQESIDTFISITGASKSFAAQILQEHGGDLTAAINAHFNTRQAFVAAPPRGPRIEYPDDVPPVVDWPVTIEYPDNVPPVPQISGQIPHESNNIEEDMVRAAIEVSKREVEGSVNLHIEDDNVEKAVSLSLKWGGLSSLEHDEAVMLEAAMFGGIPDHESRYQFMQGSTSALPIPSAPPSPTLETQRLLRKQQDDGYVASLQADKESELKAQEVAEAHQLIHEAAHVEDWIKQEESRQKIEEEQELERQLQAKEASLPPKPAPDDENAITLLIRMPDGSRCTRRFLRSYVLQSLFDFVDSGRNVNPGTYRLVRPYPRRAFSDGDRGLTLNELGLTSKHEALFLEML